MDKSTKQMVQEILEQPRKQVVERLMHGFGQIMTADQYKKAEQAFLTMPDDAFKQMVEDSIRSVRRKAPTPAQHFKLGMKLRERFKVNLENSALNSLPAECLSSEESAELWETISRSEPSDYISLTKVEDTALCKLWRKRRSLPEETIPSDIFFTGEIRFMDCYINVDERADNGLEVEYRVVVFPDYKERIKDAGGQPENVGAIVLEHQDFEMFIPMKVCEGVDVMMVGYVGFHNAPDEYLRNYNKKVKQMDILQMGYECMSTWYGIQMTPQALRRA